jgi:aryl-alcohol dehydrogenase-like predicted oxidoreductase
VRQRALGAGGFEIPVVVLGAYPLGGTNWGPRDDEEALRALRAAFDGGMTAVDTAPVYGFGVSEELVGRALDGRDDVRVLSKVGLRWDSDHGPLAYRALDANGQMRDVHHDGRPASVQREVEQSLTRLQLEQLDLVQLHAPDPGVPVGETVGALAELVSAGKVRAIGTSNLSLEQMTQAHSSLRGIGGLTSEQLHYSLLTRGAEEDRLPWAAANDVGVLAYSPLDQGLLTGAVPANRQFPKGDKRAGRATFQPENRRRINAILDDVVQPIADGHAATLAQTVLAWTIDVTGVTAVLAGARTERHVQENLHAGTLELADDERAAVGRAFADLELQAPKTPGLMARVLGRLRGR